MIDKQNQLITLLKAILNNENEEPLKRAETLESAVHTMDEFLSKK